MSSMSSGNLFSKYIIIRVSNRDFSRSEGLGSCWACVCVGGGGGGGGVRKGRGLSLSLVPYFQAQVGNTTKSVWCIHKGMEAEIRACKRLNSHFCPYPFVHDPGECLEELCFWRLLDQAGEDVDEGLARILCHHRHLGNHREKVTPAYYNPSNFAHLAYNGSIL